MLGDLVSLKGVVKYPVRIKCALLGWNTLLEALEESGKVSAQPSHSTGSPW